MTTTALLLIDIQNDYFPGGKMELDGANAAAANAAQLLSQFRERGWLIIHIVHESLSPHATFFLPDSDGQLEHKDVAVQTGERVVTKNFPNSFFQTDLLDILKGEGVERLVITGMMTHMCVDATLRAGKEHGFECILVPDATATRALEYKGRTVAAAQVQTALLGAFQMLADQILETEECLQMLSE